jgi:ketosteroid isomerase-like protein
VENVDVVRRAYEAMNSRDWSRVDEFLHEDVEFDLSRNVLNPDVYRGHAEFVKLVAAIEDVWDDFRMDVEEVTETGDGQVVTGITIRGKGTGSGVPAEMPLFQVWDLRDGKVARVVGGFRDRAEAMEFARQS